MANSALGWCTKFVLHVSSNCPGIVTINLPTAENGGYNTPRVQGVQHQMLYSGNNAPTSPLVMFLLFIIPLVVLKRLEGRGNFQVILCLVLKMWVAQNTEILLKCRGECLFCGSDMAWVAKLESYTLTNGSTQELSQIQNYTSTPHMTSKTSETDKQDLSLHRGLYIL